MGNINSLERTGPTSIPSASGTFVYDYGSSGNQLQSFTNGSSYTRNFQYNGQGSVVADGQMKMAYNELNLPKEIRDYSNNLKVAYLYDARGRKLTKQSSIETRHYINGVEYIQDDGTGTAIDLIHTEDGIARNIGGTYHYEYFLKDHLGNNRVVYNNAGTVLQQTDYYPFGMEINRKTTSPKMNYTYNGKELQQEIDQYDYGARFYDPVVGRWNVIDPMAESYHAYSGYNYALNDPIGKLDPNGMWVEQADGFFTENPDEIADFMQEMKRNERDRDKKKDTNGKDSPGMLSKARNLLNGLANLFAGAEMQKMEAALEQYIETGDIQDYLNNQISIAHSEISGDFRFGAYGPVRGSSGLRRVTKRVLKPLGLGSTGRTTANNLVEQMAMKDAMANPYLGTRLMEGMKDARWSGWTKMEYKVKTEKGVNAIIHYVGKWENGVLKAVDDFKFK